MIPKAIEMVIKGSISSTAAQLPMVHGVGEAHYGWSPYGLWLPLPPPHTTEPGRSQPNDGKQVLQENKDHSLPALAVQEV